MPTPTQWWHTIDDAAHPGLKKVVCTLCPRQCHIPQGGRGFCFVRANENDKLVLTTYGRSSGFCIDPIEKKPLFHFYPGTPILSFGTAGCNLGCKFCQNWDISKSRDVDTLTQSASPQAIIQAALDHHCTSLAFTYNDPIIWAEYAIDVAQVAHEQGVKTVAVTAGYINPEPARVFFSHMDAANVDLKGFTEDFYRRLCQGQLKPVLDLLIYLVKETPVWVEITTLLIPGENDSSDEIQALSDWIFMHLGPDVPLHFTAFHPDYKMPNHLPTPVETLLRAREIALNSGINYVYVGNVHAPAAESTYCPQCHALLIERDWHQIRRYTLTQTGCPQCGSTIPGHFSPSPGSWGRARLPLPIIYE